MNLLIFTDLQEEEEELAKMKDSVSSQKGVTLEEMSHPTAKEAQEQAIPKTLEKYEQLCELSRAYPLAKTSASVRIKNNYQSTC